MSTGSECAVYAIVRAGGRQEKVAVGDVLEVDRMEAQPGDSVDLPVLLLVDGAEVTTDKSALAKVSVTVEVVAATKGPKIDILKFKNKTGYRKRQGHRQQHTQVRVTGIETGSKSKSASAKTEPAEKATKTSATETAATEKTATKATTKKTATKKTATKPAAGER